MPYVEIFNVVRTGETVFVKDVANVKEALVEDRVLIIIDDDNRLIHLWKGLKSSVALKFIGARLSQQVRGSRGLLYKVLPSDEADEGEELKQILEVTPSLEKDKFKANPDAVDADSVDVSSYGGPPSGPPGAPSGLPEDLKKKLLDEALPDGFDREGIIRGKDFYGVARSVSKVMGKEIVKEEIAKTDVPDGVMFDKSYGIRMLIKGGKIDAVEVLKRKEA